MEGEEEKSKFRLSTVIVGLIGIIIVGGLGTYIYLNSLRYQLDNSSQSSRNLNNANNNLNTNSSLMNDSDNDGLIDAREEFYGTDPNNPDTDGDGFSDGFEVINGYNPNGEGKLEIYGPNQTNTNS
jgi:hypothetical protein